MKVFSVSQRNEIRKDYEFEFPVNDFTYECGLMTIVETESESCKGVSFPERNTTTISADFGLSWSFSYKQTPGEIVDYPEEIVDVILAKLELLESVHYNGIGELMESITNAVQSVIDRYKEE